MKGPQWQKKQQKQQQAWRQRQMAGHYWQQQQRKQQEQRQIPQRGLQRTSFEDSSNWELDPYYGDWENNDGVLGFFKTVLKFVIVGLILFFVLRAIL
ncbi:MAG: hypothetical protein ACE5R6_20470 [Candidatus Heimdallarchaeota archaeon]